MKVIISDNDGTVLEILSIPLEFDADEIRAATRIVELITNEFEVEEDD